MHDGDRRHAAHRLRERLARLVGVRAARLDAQQRRDGLQVVLDPVVDLADRRVLGDELLLLMAQLGHVAAEHDRADAVAVVAERDRAQRHRDAARLDVGAPRRASGHHERAATRRTGAWPGRMRVVDLAAATRPRARRRSPSRLNADSALGLAKVVMPSTSSRMSPSEARGAPRRGAVGADRSGKSPEAIMPNRSSAQSLKVICCRDGVRVSPRLVWRVSTPIVSARLAVAGRARSARRARGSESPRTSPARPSRRCARSGTPRAPACATAAAPGRRRCRGRTASPRRSGRVCATATNESSAVGTQMTMSAKARSASS